ncbi:ATP-binding cassette domain-containing protein [Shewanella submarina]|uniref:ATP-binding cassette domain-containing protein n=1 Tax=Shewanella submarina TaxID=2016376 RepID=A0ABV7GDC9_9GAMM|nr:ATP-binding cassette domain-containing protein [Shewanella submarina]MCL1039209.1 ATP-binding cassette domain-containing protein [Shewanella submarina]
MLALHNGLVKFRAKQVTLPNIELKRGEVCGLQGPSGAGKSTLAAVLSGSLNRHGGTLTTPGYARGGANPVQWVVQRPEQAFNPRLTLAQSLDEAWQGRDYNRLLSKLEIEKNWLNRRPNTLSGGQLQRINLLRALSPDTEYLLCDEITAQLDMLTQQKIWQSLLLLAAERNLGLLVISHDDHLLKQICHRIIQWPDSQS